jgi:hypothetical protein
LHPEKPSQESDTRQQGKPTEREGQTMTEVRKSNCENCAFRQRAEKKPNSILARLWRWHTTWCPGWKAYQESLQKS